ncbi:hypothetical protein [Halovenus marina]|uniref:hypothetical protein n=1 Tax=Halovenus marina TaxID=3396621 RepID=UPI003F579704
MYDIVANRRDNRLRIDLTGRMNAASIDEAADVAVEEAEQLRDGFDIITDLSGFRPPSPEAAKPIKRAQQHLKEMGVDRVVRVVDEETSEVVVNAFERRSRDVGYRGEQAGSLDEAERMLEQEQIEGYAD